MSAPQPCGTYGAYQRHVKGGQEPCPACREARNLYARVHRLRKPRELRPCGTEAAYRRHLRHGETPCDACKETQYARYRKERPVAAPRRVEPEALLKLVGVLESDIVASYREGNAGGGHLRRALELLGFAAQEIREAFGLGGEAP